MNHHGRVPLEAWPPPEFRSTFPVKYFFIDFGCSVRFPSTSDPCERLVKPFKITRVQRAPETDGPTKYDPFAADVFALAHVFYACFKVWLSPRYRAVFMDIFICKIIVPDIPGFLELLQDMSSYNPSSRISAMVALDQLRTMRPHIPPETLSQVREIQFEGYFQIPRSPVGCSSDP